MNHKQKVAIVVGALVIAGVLPLAHGDEANVKAPPRLCGTWIVDWEYCLERTVGREATRIARAREERPYKFPANPEDSHDAGFRSLYKHAKALARQTCDKVAAELVLKADYTFAWALNGTTTRGTWVYTSRAVVLVGTHRDDKELQPHHEVPLLRDGDCLLGRRSDMGDTLNVYTRKE